MLLMGMYFMRKEKGTGDFFKGGGRIPWWAAGISIYATMISAITYMAIPAKAYTTDWTYYPILWMMPNKRLLMPAQIMNTPTASSRRGLPLGMTC